MPKCNSELKGIEWNGCKQKVCIKKREGGGGEKKKKNPEPKRKWSLALNGTREAHEEADL